MRPSGREAEWKTPRDGATRPRCSRGTHRISCPAGRLPVDRRTIISLTELLTRAAEVPKKGRLFLPHGRRGWNSACRRPVAGPGATAGKHSAGSKRSWYLSCREEKPG